MFTEPLAGWRQVSVRATRTKADWAVEMAGLLEGRYAACEKVIVVCDNLNTHTTRAFYEVFEPERGLVRRGQAAKITVNAYPGRTFNGKVAFFDPTVTAETRTGKVRIELANPGGLLKPSMYASVELAAGPARARTPAARPLPRARPPPRPAPHAPPRPTPRRVG